MKGNGEEETFKEDSECETFERDGGCETFEKGGGGRMGGEKKCKKMKKVVDKQLLV